MVLWEVVADLTSLVQGDDNIQASWGCQRFTLAVWEGADFSEG